MKLSMNNDATSYIYSEVINNNLYNELRQLENLPGLSCFFEEPRIVMNGDRVGTPRGQSISRACLTMMGQKLNELKLHKLDHTMSALIAY